MYLERRAFIRNEEISRELNCLSLESYLTILKNQYNMHQDDYEITQRNMDLSVLLCPQPSFVNKLYQKIVNQLSYLEEPLVCVRTHDHICFYLIAGNTRARVAFDQGKKTAPAFVIFTYNQSLEDDLERASVIDFQKGTVRHIWDLEEIG